MATAIYVAGISIATAINPKQMNKDGSFYAGLFVVLAVYDLVRLLM